MLKAEGNSYAMMIQRSRISQRGWWNRATLFSVSLSFKHCRIGIFEEDVRLVSPSAGYIAIPILALTERTIPLKLAGHSNPIHHLLCKMSRIDFFFGLPIIGT